MSHHFQNLDDVQAQAVHTCTEIIDFLVEAGMSDTSAEQLRSLLESGLIKDVLTLAEDFGKSIAYMNHDALLDMEIRGWDLLCIKLTIQKKAVIRKLRLLEADKNADETVLENFRSNRHNLDQDLAVSRLQYAKLNLMSQLPLELPPGVAALAGSSAAKQG